MKNLEQIKIENMSNGAFAIAHDPNGQVIFVENLCPGDIADLEIYDERKDFAFANYTKIDSLSEFRNPDPRCKIHKICGSCQWQHIDYSKQLEYKKNNLLDLIRKSKINFEAESVENVIGMDDPWNYRNKVIYPVSTVASTGRLQAGYFKRNSRELINVKYCPIQYSIFDQIIETLKDLCTKNEINSKVLRHLLVRSNHDQSELLVSLIMRRQSFNDEMKKSLGNIFRRISKDFPQVKTCTINYNDKSTNVILGDSTETILGEGFINETFEGLRLKISTTSFFQINTTQFSKIINLIADDISTNGQTETIKILDTYCGIGTISLALAKRFPNMKIQGIEEVPAAIDDAENNAKANNIKADFICSTIEDYVSQQEFNTNTNSKNLDYIIINPPRKGCTNKVLDAIAQIKTKKVFYVSCNPATLVRDIKYLEQYGFKTQSITGIDMFPHTYHVECLAVLMT